MQTYSLFRKLSLAWSGSVGEKTGRWLNITRRHTTPARCPRPGQLHREAEETDPCGGGEQETTDSSPINVPPAPFIGSLGEEGGLALEIQQNSLELIHCGSPSLPPICLAKLLVSLVEKDR